MLQKISQEIKAVLSQFSEKDSLLFNNQVLEINPGYFTPLYSAAENNAGEEKTVAFVDGGQAEILSAGNFCLSFIRVSGVIFSGNKKIDHIKNEFYLFTRAKYINDDLFYESKVYPLTDKIIEENDLLISSNDSSIKIGIERAPIGKVANMARRFAELSLAAQLTADFIVLDGTLEPTFQNEEKLIARLPEKASALAKSSSLFTASGNSPVALLDKIGPSGCWSYFIAGHSYFVKLHEKSKHVFRFEGNKEALPYLVKNSQDALFLGYPYGLIFVDKMARVSNKEQQSLMVNFLLRKENKEIVDYLKTSNAHNILDRIQ